MRNRKNKSVTFSALLIAVITVVVVCLTACGTVTPVGGGNNNNNNNNNNTDKYCSVVFYVGEGSAIPSQTVKVGELVARPASPTRRDYVFGGWYGDSGLQTEWNFDVDTASGDTLVLYAMWTPVQGGPPEPIPEFTTVTFVTGCSATVSPQVIKEGDKVSQPNVTNEGYTLDGWYNGSAKWNFATDTVSGKTLTLTAKWTKNATPPIVGDGDDVTVTFNVGLDARKAGTYNPAAVTVKAGSTISEPQLTRSGYEVSGWYAEEDSAKKWNFATDKVTENVTLFAKWQAGGGVAIEYTPTMQDNNTLYIHYLRSNGDYDGWYIYNWNGNNNQEIKNTVAKDASGAVFAVNLKDSINNGLSTINFIVTQAGWNKDGGDNTVTLSNAQKVGGSYHWYVRQGDTANGSNRATAVSSGGGANRQTEPKRASVGNVNRATAAALPTMKTVSGWDEMGVGYQIFVASFYDSNGDGCGDLNGITSKLDYLQSLNVDVLWLTPIQSSNSYHGYDCYDYYSIDPKFGTNADYRRLVSEAHKRGMKIVMDLVVNHTSQQNEWFQKSKDGVIEEVTYQDGTKATVKYRDFYRWKKGGGNRYHSAGEDWYFYSSFNSSMPELNYDYQPVRDAMVDVAAYWMSYGLDGFRMDAIKHVFMWDESENAGGDVEGATDERESGYNYNETKNLEFFKEFNYKLKTKYPHCYLLGEQLKGDPAQVSPFYKGMDSLFDFNTYYDLPQRISGNNGGAAAQATAFNANAQRYQTDRGDKPINCMITSNHDIPRLSYKLNNDTAKMKLYMAVTMTMPGLTWIYYGDEIGLHSKGEHDDNSYRQSMKWTSSWANKCTKINDYQINNDVKSVAEQQSDNNSLLSYVKSLTKFRNDNPTLINGTATCSEDNGMLKIVVTGGGKTYTVYHNFSNSSKTVSGNVVFGSNTVPAYGTAIVK